MGVARRHRQRLKILLGQLVPVPYGDGLLRTLRQSFFFLPFLLPRIPAADLFIFPPGMQPAAQFRKRHPGAAGQPLLGGVLHRRHEDENGVGGQEQARQESGGK